MTVAAKYYACKVQFIEALLSSQEAKNWDSKLLEDTEIKCNFVKGYTGLLFPGGIREVVDFAESYYDQKMVELLSATIVPSKIREKIALALKVRIKTCVPKEIHLMNSVYFATPSNTLFASKMAFRTCDMIWRYAGDESVDHNYYSKRSLLLSVYVSTIIYYCQDQSVNNIDTDEYIAESLSDIINISSKLKSIIKLPKLVDIPIVRLFF